MKRAGVRKRANQFAHRDNALGKTQGPRTFYLGLVDLEDVKRDA